MATQYQLNVTILVAALLIAAPSVSLGAETAVSCKWVRTSANTTTFAECNFPGTKSEPEASARNFINAYLGDLRMKQGSTELTHIEMRRGLGSQHTRFQQIFGGHPVYNAYVSVHQGIDGRIRRLHTSYTPDQKILGAAQAVITRAQAEYIARQAAGEKEGMDVAELRLPSRSRRLIWFPRQDGQLILAWELTIFTDPPLGDFLTVVDAHTGEVWVQENRIAFYETGRGYVYRPNPVQTSGITGLQDSNDATPSEPEHPLNKELKEVLLPGLESSTGLLKGRFVDVVILNAPHPPQRDYPDADEPDREYFYNRTDPRFEQVIAYSAIDSLQRYIHALGFGDDDDDKLSNGIRDYPTLVNVHWDDRDQSFYSIGDEALHFGDGGVDDAEDADIILHEYGHALQHAQNICWGGGEMGAMGEGFSDYLAAAFHASEGDPAYQKDHAACVGEWDGTAYSTTDPPCLRRVDGKKIYPDDLIILPPNPSPEDLSRKIHKDGEIWSRALWDIRAAIGGSTADQIILEHHFSLPCNATMPMAALEMIDVDANLFGGAYEGPLRKAFCDRGILRDQDCALPPKQIVIVEVAKDSFLRQLAKDRNEGTNSRLRLKGGYGEKIRIVLGFDLAHINPDEVKSAVLELHIATTDKEWGRYGQPVDAHPLPSDFAEGDGLGAGVTWNCAVDGEIANLQPDCDPFWAGGRGVDGTFDEATAAPVVHTNAMMGKVIWGVTADVKAGISRWLIKKRIRGWRTGRVEYYSREGAGEAGNMELAPRLVITLK
jgi:fungalysin metallopeptidase (M36)/fungalysin/thermolysin propeptide